MQTTALVRAGTVLALAVCAFVGGCSESKTLPVGMTGSFVRTDQAFFGPKVSNLDVTPTGIVGRFAGMGMEVSANPLANSGHIRHTESVATSVLFKSVSCTATSCRFVGPDCEGTITKDDAGDVTIVSSAACASISGRWLGPQSASKTATLP